MVDVRVYYKMYNLLSASHDDISDALSCTRVVDPKMLKIAPLEVPHPLPNFIVLSDSFEVSRGSIKDGS